jgi:hypothetical protein
MSFLTSVDSKIPDASHNLELMLDRSTIIYGSSGAGKSTIIKHIMSLLGANISISILLSDNPKIASIYDGVHPSCSVIVNPQVQHVLNIFNEQQKRAEIYDFVNDINRLKKIFDSVSSLSEKKGEERILSCMTSENKTQIKHLLSKYYKAMIIRNEKSIRHDDTEAKFIFKNINFNPRMALFIDDASIFFKKLSIDPNGMDLFFRSRHAYITMIFASHDETLVSTKSRNGAFNTIFGDIKSLSGYIHKETNKLSREERFNLDRLSKTVNFGAPDYTKIMICRESLNPVWTFKASLNGRICDKIWTSFEKKYRDDNKYKIQNNPYYKLLS